jgi:predicted dienelactone hydrolase
MVFPFAWRRGGRPSAARVPRRSALRTTPGLVALLLLLGCATFREALAPSGPPAGSESARRLAPGPHEVARRDFRFVDGDRPTPAHGDFRGAPTRTLVTTLWAPQAADGLHPLVVYSHGFMSRREGGTYLARHLASHGYVVAAADFPATNGDAPGGPNVEDVVNQPQDVRFLIDSVLALEGDARPFEGAIDEARIGVMGLSLGGLTSTLVAFHPALGDPRVRVAISIAGPGEIFSRRFFEAGDVPFLMIAGTADAIVPYAANAPRLLERVPGGALVTLDGGSHVGFADLAPRVFRFSDNPDAIGCRYLRRNLDVDADPDPDGPFAALGGPAVGIELREDAARPCADDALVHAMRPARQHVLTTLAVRAFLDSVFADSESARSAASRYLAHTFAVELPEARFERSPVAAPPVRGDR